MGEKNYYKSTDRKEGPADKRKGRGLQRRGCRSERQNQRADIVERKRVPLISDAMQCNAMHD